jgi:ParB/RepB/Spo0J family partition protein
MAKQPQPPPGIDDAAATLVPLDEIVDNPWQPRHQVDEQALADLMASIEADGLLQFPVGRRNEDRMLGVVELALGHNRLEAYRRLSKSRKKGYAARYGALPVRIQDLSDLQMARLAVIENVRRDDLTTTEKARAMLRFRDEFGQSTEQIGEIFGVDAATVRGIIRLLNLPESLHPFLDSGLIPQVAARQLLALQKVAPKAVAAVAKQLDRDDDFEPDYPDQIVDWATDAIGDEAAPIFRNYGAGEVPFSEKWKPGKAAVKRAPGITAAAATKAFPEFAKADLEHAHARVNGAQSRGGDVPQEAIDKIVHLSSPPACSACPFYAKVGGRGYCGVPACLNRKTAMWRDEELHRVARKLGVKIFDKAADGKLYQEAPGYCGGNAWWDQAVEEKAEHLRVMLVREKGWGHYSYTESKHVELVSVHEKFVKQLEEQAETKPKKETWAERQARQDAERIITRGNQAKNRRILDELVTPHLGAVLKPLDSPDVLEQIYFAFFDQRGLRKLGELPRQKTKRAEVLRQRIMRTVAGCALDREDRDEQEVKPTAKWLKLTLAPALGIKLPADFVNQALTLAETMKPCEQSAWCGWHPADELNAWEVDGGTILLCHEHHQEALGHIQCERCKNYFDREALIYIADDLLDEPEGVLERLEELDGDAYEYLCHDCNGEIDKLLAQIKQQPAGEAADEPA